MLIIRLRETYEMVEVRSTGPEWTEAGWVAKAVTASGPRSLNVVEAVRRAVAPMPVETFPVPALPRRC